jgi:hypothetical protein
MFSSDFTVDRDSARWGLSPKMIQRRRTIFWDLFVADAYQVGFMRVYYPHLFLFLQSLNTGRPPSSSLAYIDCGFPKPEGTSSKFAASRKKFC